ncbi:class I SAM-dependent methyltransferase [Bremerella cremea]|uniref:Class I SAM-dependent methyltransferase n=1 Tax=Bremerella cremea TaxID=1031537 RepID=A0A368KP64_9BACT|nr:class I SAM-dependent methyltransferase [Bremerella cremea]RCS46357.1 class I SAM-dependent methyltransferase [Bremerella cremea]
MSKTSAASEKSVGYTNVALGPIRRLNELWSLLQLFRSTEFVTNIVAQVQASLKEIETVSGKPCVDCDILEVGSGQNMIQLACLSLENRAIGIDTESPVPDDFDVRALIRLLREDGTVRAAKTLLRSIAGINRRIRKAYIQETGAPKWPKLDVRKMDAQNLTFDANSFDVVYSRAVFEHISDPASALKELRRVIRPGGVFYCVFHLYTSDSGCHDIRIFNRSKSRPPFWAHLRPDVQHLVCENTYLNRLRLQDWYRIFQEQMPGAEVTPLMDGKNPSSLDLQALREQGELKDYSDAELLSPSVKVVWRKPEDAQ